MSRVPESKGDGAKIRLTMNCLRLLARRANTSASPLELEGLKKEEEGLGVDVHPRRAA